MEALLSDLVTQQAAMTALLLDEATSQVARTALLLEDQDPLFLEYQVKLQVR